MRTSQSAFPYTYGDANWKDKLTAYNGTTITYDTIGNPLNDGTWTYEWEADRRLKQMSKDGMIIQFKYDHNGLRTSKIVNGVETKYILSGKQITHMTVGNDSLHFFYDAQGRPVKVDFNGTMYTYIHNIQGDIVGILDSAGDLVVEYKYDAWGNPLSTTGSMSATLGKYNPFRYRGYVFDEEAGLYYLRSRYYNHTVGRFLNVDTLIPRYKNILSGNLFSYCKNHPIYSIDRDGRKSYFGIDISDAFLSSSIVTEIPDNEQPVPYDKPNNWTEYLETAGRYATYWLFRNARSARRQQKRISREARDLSDALGQFTEAKCITISLLKSNANHLIMNPIEYILRKQSENCTSSGILLLIFIDFIPYQV